MAVKLYRNIISLSFCLALLASACTKASDEQTYVKQDTLIDKYVRSLIAPCDTLSLEETDGVTVLVVDKVKDELHERIQVTYSGGSTRVTLTEGEGDALLRRGSVTFFYAGFDFSSGTLSNGSLFVTNNKEFADGAGWNCMDSLAVKLKISDARIVEGLKKGLVGVKPGEECLVLFPGSLGFGSSPVATIPTRAPLAYRIWVEDVEN